MDKTELELKFSRKEEYKLEELIHATDRAIVSAMRCCPISLGTIGLYVPAVKLVTVEGDFHSKGWEYRLDLLLAKLREEIGPYTFSANNLCYLGGVICSQLIAHPSSTILFCEEGETTISISIDDWVTYVCARMLVHAEGLELIKKFIADTVDPVVIDDCH